MTAHMELPGALTASPKQVARAIWRAHRRKKGRVYVLGRWRLIMALIKSIPDTIFKKMKL
jgi:short-subunit dehydrogenase